MRTHTITGRMTAGVLAVGVIAGLVVTVPAAAFAAARPRTATSTTVGSTTSAAAGSTNGGPAGAATATIPSRPACTPSVFSQAQQRVEANLAARVTQLNALQSAVNATSNQLTSGDRQTLQNDITNVELPGIQALQPQAQQATTCAQLFKVAHPMVFNFRVYVVMTPQTHLTIVADDETYVEGQLANLEPVIAQAIQNAQAHGKDVTAAQAAFTDLKSQVSAAQSATAGQAAQVLAQTPAGYPGNWPVFLTARADLVSAHTDLHSAYADAQKIRVDLT